MEHSTEVLDLWKRIPDVNLESIYPAITIALEKQNEEIFLKLVAFFEYLVFEAELSDVL